MAKKKSRKKNKFKVRYVEAAPVRNPLMEGLKSVLPETASGQLLAGILVGGVAAYVLGDEKLRETMIRQGVKAVGSLAGGIAEIKEQIADIQAEIRAEQST